MKCDELGVDAFIGICGPMRLCELSHARALSLGLLELKRLNRARERRGFFFCSFFIEEPHPCKFLTA